MSGFREKLKTFQTFWKGFRSIEEKGEYLPEAYPAFRKLFVETNGWFNDIFHYWYNFSKPYKPVTTSETRLLNLNGEEGVVLAVEGLDKDGYYVFPNRIDEQTLAELMEFSLTTPCILRYDKTAKKPYNVENEKEASEGTYLKLGYSKRTDILFDERNLIASNYHFDPTDILNNQTVQALLADAGIVNIAQRYFRSQAMITDVGMWWTTPYGHGTPSSDLAQLYHFDMERIKFVKFFCYLTDVGPDDGPHNFVRGSHKRMPKSLQRDGRFQDSEILGVYERSEIVEIDAPRGTVFVEDTRGFHKATMPTRGCRLLLEISMASCLFGPEYPRFPIKIVNSALQELYNQNPNVFSNFDVTSGISLSQDAIPVSVAKP